MDQVQLKPYHALHFPILASWITGPEMLFQFSGTEFVYPITEDQIKSYQERNPDRRFYMGYYGQLPVFFGEIIPQEGVGPRLGRLLIGNLQYRRKGLGLLFTRLMIAECKRLFNCEAVELFVWDNNTTAIGCYKKIGFEFIPIDPFNITRDGQTYDLKKMRIYADDERIRVG